MGPQAPIEPQSLSLTNFVQDSGTPPVGISRAWVQGGGSGVRPSDIRASPGVRLPFSRLQGTQARTQLVQVVRPPRERGITWSIVSCAAPGWVPQYWQV